MIGIVNLYKILIFVLTMFTSLSMNGQVDPGVDFDLSGCHNAAIAVYAYGGNGETAPAGAHNYIQITGNSTSGSSNPAIAVTSTSKLILKSNTIESPNNELLVPWVMNEFGRKEDPSREIYLKNVENIEDNTGID